jgi:hypothetical protein
MVKTKDLTKLVSPDKNGVFAVLYSRKRRFEKAFSRRHNWL